MLSTRVPCHFQDDSVVSKWQPLGTGGPQFVHDAWLGSAFNSAFKGGVSCWACSVGGNHGPGVLLVLRASLGRLRGGQGGAHSLVPSQGCLLLLPQFWEPRSGVS